MAPHTHAPDSTAPDHPFWKLTTEVFCSIDVQDGRMQMLHGAWTNVVGFSDAELQTTPFFSLVHPDDVEATRIALETIAEAHDTARFACRLRIQGGTYRHTEWTAIAGQSPQQVHASGRDVTDLMAAKTHAQLHEGLMGQVAKGAPVVISLYDREGIYLTQIGAGLEKLGLQPNQLRGVSVFEAFRGADEALSHIRAALEGHQAANTQDLGTTVWDNWFSPTHDARGEISGAISISTDVTERERSRQALEDRLRVIEEQSRAIRMMSAPIIEVWQGVLVVPVVGQLDAESATNLMEQLLSTVVQRGASFAILDLTAVDHIESSTAEHLLRMIAALGLLGTRGLLSGIRPSVARSMIELGIDLGKVTSVSSLHAALRACMKGLRGQAGH